MSLTYFKLSVLQFNNTKRKTRPTKSFAFVRFSPAVAIPAQKLNKTWKIHFACRQHWIFSITPRWVGTQAWAGNQPSYLGRWQLRALALHALDDFLVREGVVTENVAVGAGTENVRPVVALGNVGQGTWVWNTRVPTLDVSS